MRRIVAAMCAELNFKCLVYLTIVSCLQSTPRVDTAVSGDMSECSAIFSACAQIVYLLMHLLHLSAAGMPREFKQSLKS